MVPSVAMTGNTKTRLRIMSMKGELILERTYDGVLALPRVEDVLWIEGESGERTWYQVRGTSLGFPKSNEAVAAALTVERLRTDVRVPAIETPSLKAVRGPETLSVAENGSKVLDDDLILAMGACFGGSAVVRLFESNVPSVEGVVQETKVGERVLLRSKHRNLLWVVTLLGAHNDGATVSIERYALA